MKKYTLWVLVAAAVLTSNLLAAQDLEVTDASTPPFTPENLISNIFLGDGVEVIDVTYQGDPLAVGYFNHAENEIGIERGIILTSGRAGNNSLNCTAPFGANCVGNQFASNDANSNASDPDIAAIATGGLQTNDVAKYTITFIPTADTLRFKYVFASEEYPEWGCSSFNDVFGFFISGPGISGPFENNGINIALIPGTNIPVTINNIHPQNPGNPSCTPVFENLYNNNNGSNNQPVYDGFLDVFIAEAIVIPCETYTIKLIVADVGDSAYDTGVFLEAKSFGTGSLQVETATVSLDGTITEGCANGSMTFSFPSPVEADFPLDYTIIGTAENGVDYESIPLDLFIPVGDSSITVNFVGIEDALDEGMESIGIDIQRDVCNRDTFWIFVRDNEILPPELGDDQSICLGDSVLLDATLPIPLPDPPSFTSTSHDTITHLSPTYSDILVAGVQPVTLGPGVIQSVCVNIQHKWVDDLDLFLLSPGGQFIELSTDNGSNCDNYNQVCFTPTATTVISDGFPFDPCSANVQASFTGGTFLPEGVWSDLWDGDYPTNGTWQLLVVDDQAGFNGSILDWTITFEPLYQVFYKWEPEDGLSCSDCPTPTATPQATTTYTVTAWDTYGCEVTDSVTIEVKDVLPAPVVNCTAVTNNSITFGWDQIPGSMGYQVNVDGAGLTVPNNGPLSHIVTGLTLSDSVTIEVFAIGECDGLIGTATCYTPDCDAPTLSVDNVSGVSCPGDTNGSITVSATGGAGDYVFEIDSISNTTGVFTGLPAGNYPVTVIDAWGCPNSVQVSVEAPEVIELQEIIVAEISCFGSADGVVTVDVTGGVLPYIFEWNGVPADSVLSNAGPGAQSLVVTDANGCSASATIDLTEPALLAINVAADSANCANSADGAAQVLIAGGTEPYAIEWDAAAGNSTDALVQNLPAGTYSVLVTDDNGCQQSASVQVGEPAAMLTTLAAQNPLCNGTADGSATVTVDGGQPSYSYQWNSGSDQATASGLTSGVYSVTVTDGNSCTVVDSITLAAANPIFLTLTPSNLNCFNAQDGGVTSQVSGGAGTFVYQWSNGSAATNLVNLPAGNYCLTVTDANGCEAIECVDVLQPAELVLSTSPTNAGCNGGSDGAVDLTVQGGSGGFTYNWDNGATTEDLANLTAGSYSVVVSDANGCTAATSVSISETDAVVILLESENVNCNGGNDGSITASVTGGSGNFNYSWSGPGGFVSSNQNPAGLQAGSYTVTVEDTDGCNAVASVTLTEPATAIEALIASAEMICFNANNGSATVSATGGAGNYSYAWSNGQNTAVASNLNAGSYTVTVTDSNGCQDVAQVEIEQQAALSVELSQTSATCHNAADGTATVENILQGGSSQPVSDFEIDWSGTSQNSATVSGLTGGQSYTVTITNDLGCTASASIAIVNPAPIEAAVVSKTDVKCDGGKDGVATVAGSGGTQPYGYVWSANANGQTTATATNLPPGNFTVTVSDANGCSTTVQLEISEPSEIEVSFTNEKVKCFGGSDGSSFATPEGGTPPYSLSWSNGATGSLASDLGAGSITLTIIDKNGCVLEETTEIAQPDAPLAAEFEVNDVSCTGFRDGQILVSVAGGSPPYRYSLDGENFYGNPTLIALASDIYQVFVQDKNGCTIRLDDIFIGEPEPLIVDLGPDTIVFYGSHIHIHPTIINADSLEELTYAWTSNNPQTPPTYPDWNLGDFVVNSPTTATLTVTNENGCTARDIINIFVREVRNVQVPTGFAPGAGGNSLNDLLHVHGNSLMVDKIRLFRIFDRWGEVVFEMTNFDINDPTLGWDGTFQGKEMPAGVYAWYLEVDFVDGVMEAYKGNTTLIR